VKNNWSTRRSSRNVHRKRRRTRRKTVVHVAEPVDVTPIVMIEGVGEGAMIGEMEMTDGMGDGVGTEGVEIGGALITTGVAGVGMMTGADVGVGAVRILEWSLRQRPFNDGQKMACAVIGS